MGVNTVTHLPLHGDFVRGQRVVTLGEGPSGDLRQSALD
jgi:hypothetical protein